MHKLKKSIELFIIGILVILIYLHYDGIPCFFYERTGLYCPGCGITRACISLLHFDIYQAFRYNMLFIISLPLLIVYLFYRFVFKCNKQIPNYVWCFLLVITISFGILRNIQSFSFLSPTLIK